jgi:hypothetical protein
LLTPLAASALRAAATSVLFSAVAKQSLVLGTKA